VTDDETLEHMEIDIEVAGCIEILEANGVAPETHLVSDLWMETLRTAGGDA
jgi:hypothetical protein